MTEHDLACFFAAVTFRMRWCKRNYIRAIWKFSVSSESQAQFYLSVFQHTENNTQYFIAQTDCSLVILLLCSPPQEAKLQMNVYGSVSMCACGERCSKYAQSSHHYDEAITQTKPESLTRISLPTTIIREYVVNANFNLSSVTCWAIERKIDIVNGRNTILMTPKKKFVHSFSSPFSIRKIIWDEHRKWKKAKKSETTKANKMKIHWNSWKRKMTACSTVHLRQSCSVIIH